MERIEEFTKEKQKEIARIYDEGRVDDFWHWKTQRDREDFSQRIYMGWDYNETEAVAKLMENGDAVNTLDENNITPLVYAVRRDSEADVKMLLEYGANINYGNKNIDCNYPIIEASIRNNTKMVKMLVENGADINVRDFEEDLTPLHFACGDENEELVKFFMDKGVDVNSNTDVGPTALMTACNNENTNIVQILIDNGANINWKDSDGVTAINEASFREKPEIVSLLLDNGADMNAADKWGDTALTKAIEYENTDIVRLIKNHINRMVSLVIKKGRTKDEIPLVPHSHKDIAYCIALYVTE